MKITFVFVCVVIGVLAKTRLEEEKEKLHEIHEECQADPATYADDELLEDLSNNLGNPQDENGQLDLDAIREKVALCVEDEQEVDRLVEECAKQRETPGKTAVYLFMCLDQNGVTYFHEF